MNDTDFARVSEHSGMRVVNVTPHGNGHGKQARAWLGGAGGGLAALAAVCAAVSIGAQYDMVRGVKHNPFMAGLEAPIPDIGALIFAMLGVALALHAKRALRPRALNAACVGISLMQNALAAPPGGRNMAIWVMPAAVYAVASDTLIAVVRSVILARQRADGTRLADDEPTLLAVLGGVALWLLRLVLALPSTLSGFREWVVNNCPVAPGVRPGHLAQLQAVRAEAAGRVALAARERNEAAGQAAEQARQAAEEAAQARGAEAAARAELDRVHAEANQLATKLRVDALREREAVREAAERQIIALREEFHQVREDSGRLLAQVRNAAAAQVSALEEARAELAGRARQTREDADALRAERDQLAAQLQAAAIYQTARRPRRSREGEPQDRAVREAPKRDKMIELAAARRDLAGLPLAEVSGLANQVAGEIDYAPGTARRELLRYVRQIQSGTGQSSNSVGGEEDALSTRR